MLPHPEDNLANYNPWKPIFLRPFVSKHIEELMNCLHTNDYKVEQVRFAKKLDSLFYVLIYMFIDSE